MLLLLKMNPSLKHLNSQKNNTPTNNKNKRAFKSESPFIL